MIGHTMPLTERETRSSRIHVPGELVQDSLPLGVLHAATAAFSFDRPQEHLRVQRGALLDRARAGHRPEGLDFGAHSQRRRAMIGHAKDPRCEHQNVHASCRAGT